eukprot:5423277-Ditylum_brightwellii.AAC.1
MGSHSFNEKQDTVAKRRHENVAQTCRYIVGKMHHFEVAVVGMAPISMARSSTRYPRQLPHLPTG